MQTFEELIKDHTTESMTEQVDWHTHPVHGWIKPDGSFARTPSHAEFYVKWGNDPSIPQDWVHGETSREILVAARKAGWIRTGPGLVAWEGNIAPKSFKTLQRLVTRHTNEDEYWELFDPSYIGKLTTEQLAAVHSYDDLRRLFGNEVKDQPGEPESAQTFAQSLWRGRAIRGESFESMIEAGKKPYRTAQQVFGVPGKTIPLWSFEDAPFEYEVAHRPGRGWAIRHARSKTIYAVHGTEEKAKAHLAALQKKAQEKSSESIAGKGSKSLHEGAEFVGTCVGLGEENADAIIELVDGATSISNRTFRRLIGPDNYRELEGSLGYDRNLRMVDDYAVSYGYGTFKGKPAAYADWSAIEHIFVLDAPARIRRYSPKSTFESMIEATDTEQDRDADQMLQHYQTEPTNLWLYTDMPVKDRVAWAYLAADEFKEAPGDEDMLERFVASLKEVVADPETFWEQIKEKDPERAKYLADADWAIEEVPLTDIGVYPRFSGYPDEACKGNAAETADWITKTPGLPIKRKRLMTMADKWMTILHFLPPILVPGGTVRGRKEGYEKTKYDIDDGNHRVVSAALDGADSIIAFVGKPKGEEKSESLAKGKVVCAWCKKEMRDDPEIPGVSHGICPECAEKLRAEIKDTGVKGKEEESFESMIESVLTEGKVTDKQLAALIKMAKEANTAMGEPGESQDYYADVLDPKNGATKLKEWIEEADPHPRKAFGSWIAREWRKQLYQEKKTGEAESRSTGSIALESASQRERIREELTKFMQAKARKVLKGKQGDINSYSYESFSGAMEDIDPAALISKKDVEEGREEILDLNGVTEVLNKPPWLVVTGSNPSYMDDLLQGSGWCVKDGSTYAKLYLRNNEPIYVAFSTKRTDPYKVSPFKGYNFAACWTYDAPPDAESYEGTEIRDALDSRLGDNWLSKNDQTGILRSTFFSDDRAEQWLAGETAPTEEEQEQQNPYDDEELADSLRDDHFNAVDTDWAQILDSRGEEFLETLADPADYESFSTALAEVTGYDERTDRFNPSGEFFFNLVEEIDFEGGGDEWYATSNWEQIAKDMEMKQIWAFGDGVGYRNYQEKQRQAGLADIQQMRLYQHPEASQFTRFQIGDRVQVGAPENQVYGVVQDDQYYSHETGQYYTVRLDDGRMTNVNWKELQHAHVPVAGAPTFESMVEQEIVSEPRISFVGWILPTGELVENNWRFQTHETSAWAHYFDKHTDPEDMTSYELLVNLEDNPPTLQKWISTGLPAEDFKYVGPSVFGGDKIEFNSGDWAFDNGWVRTNYNENWLGLEARDEDTARQAALAVHDELPFKYVAVDIGTRSTELGPRTLKRWLAGANLFVGPSKSGSFESMVVEAAVPMVTSSTAAAGPDGQDLWTVAWSATDERTYAVPSKYYNAIFRLRNSPKAASLAKQYGREVDPQTNEYLPEPARPEKPDQVMLPGFESMIETGIAKPWPGMTYTPVGFDTKHQWVTEQMIRDVMEKYGVIVVVVDDIPREPSKHVPKELYQLVRKFRQLSKEKGEDDLNWHVKALVPDEPDDLIWDIQDVIDESFGMTSWSISPLGWRDWVPEELASVVGVDNEEPSLTGVSFESMVDGSLTEAPQPEQIKSLARKIQKRDPATWEDDPRLLGAAEKFVTAEGKGADPDPNWSNGPWILKQWKFGNIDLPKDSERVYDVLQKFMAAKKTGALSGDAADLRRYKMIADLEAALKALPRSAFVSKRQIKKGKGDPGEVPGSELVAQSENFKVYKVTTVEAAGFHGETTQWCTKDPRWAEDYLPLYVAWKRAGKGWSPVLQGTYSGDMIMDTEDEEISAWWFALNDPQRELLGELGKLGLEEAGWPLTEWAADSEKLAGIMKYADPDGMIDVDDLVEGDALMKQAFDIAFVEAHGTAYDKGSYGYQRFADAQVNLREESADSAALLTLAEIIEGIWEPGLEKYSEIASEMEQQAETYYSQEIEKALPAKLDEWFEDGIVTEEQHEALTAGLEHDGFPYEITWDLISQAQEDGVMWTYDLDGAWFGENEEQLLDRLTPENLGKYLSIWKEYIGVTPEPAGQGTLLPQPRPEDEFTSDIRQRIAQNLQQGGPRESLGSFNSMVESDWRELGPQDENDSASLLFEIESLYELEYKASKIQSSEWQGREDKEAVVHGMDEAFKKIAESVCEKLVTVFNGWLEHHALLNPRQWASNYVDTYYEGGHDPRETLGIIMRSPSDWMPDVERAIYEHFEELDELESIAQQLYDEVEADWEAEEHDEDEEYPYGDMDLKDFFFEYAENFGSVTEFIKSLPITEWMVLQIVEKAIHPYWVEYWKARGIEETRARIEQAAEEMDNIAFGGSRRYTPKQLKIKIDSFVNMAHQTGSMLDYVEEHWDLSKRDLDELSRRTTADWDQELAAMGVVERGAEHEPFKQDIRQRIAKTMQLGGPRESLSPAVQMAVDICLSNGVPFERAVEALSSFDSFTGTIQESPKIDTLKKNQKKLTDEERAEVMKRKAIWHHGLHGEESPAVSKAVVDGKTWYWSATHRAYQVRPTLDGAIKIYHDFVKTTA